MADNEIQIGYPSDIQRGRTLIKDLVSLSLATQMKVAYNDGSAQTEDSAWTEPSERDYKLPPDRLIEFWPCTEIGSKLLETTGEVTVYEQKIYIADGSLNHLDRISWLVAFNNFGAIRAATFMPAPYEYMLKVTDGTTIHYYTVNIRTGPINIKFPNDMTGSQSLTAPTMYIEVIFHDTDLSIDEAFIDGGSGTFYFAWNTPVLAWFDVYNTIDKGILGGIGFMANLGLSTLFDQLTATFIGNEQMRLAANAAKVPIEIFGTSIAVAICLAAYYNWIEVDKFLEEGGLMKLINAALNPVTVAGTLISAASGMIDNSLISLLVGKGAGAIDTWITTQAMLAVIDDIRLTAYA